MARGSARRGERVIHTAATRYLIIIRLGMITQIIKRREYRN